MFRITALDRYLVTQLTQGALFGVALFVIIWLAPETLFRLTQLLFSGKIAWPQFLQMLAFNLPETLEKSIPMAVLLACVLTFRRLSQNLELITMLAAGIRPVRLMAPVLAVGAAFMLAHGLVQEVILPHTGPRYARMLEETGLREVRDANFTFVQKNRRNEWDKFLLIGQTQRYAAHGELSDFFALFYRRDAQGNLFIARMMRADRGAWDAHQQRWILQDGVDYTLDEEGVYRQNRPFAQTPVAMSAYSHDLLHYSVNNPKTLNARALNEYLRLLRAGDQQEEIAFFELLRDQKLALPAASLAFALLGALLGMERIRTRNHYGLIFAALLMFVYVILTSVIANMGAFEIAPSWLLAWAPLAVVSALGAGLLALRRRLSEG